MAAITKKEQQLKSIENTKKKFPIPEKKYLPVGTFYESYGLWNTSLKDVRKFIASEVDFSVLKRTWSNAALWYQKTYVHRGKPNPIFHYIFGVCAMGFALNVWTIEPQLHKLQHDMEQRKKLGIKN